MNLTPLYTGIASKTRHRQTRPDARHGGIHALKPCVPALLQLRISARIYNWESHFAADGIRRVGYGKDVKHA